MPTRSSRRARPGRVPKSGWWRELAAPDRPDQPRRIGYTAHPAGSLRALRARARPLAGLPRYAGPRRLAHHPDRAWKPRERVPLPWKNSHGLIRRRTMTRHAHKDFLVASGLPSKVDRKNIFAMLKSLATRPGSIIGSLVIVGFMQAGSAIAERSPEAEMGQALMRMREASQPPEASVRLPQLRERVGILVFWTWLALDGANLPAPRLRNSDQPTLVRSAR